jgi:hypothetical protein
MKRKLTLLVVVTCFVFGFSGLTKCDAQAIVGKWRGVSVKNYYSAEYSKQIGKSMDEKSAKELGNSEIDFNADHTFVLTFSTGQNSTVTTMKGVWSSTGNELGLTLDPQYNPRKTTTSASFSITGNTMVTTAIIQPPSRIIKTISTSQKI